MDVVAGIALGMLMTASLFLCVNGLAGLVHKHRQGAVALLFGLGLFVAHAALLAGVAYFLGAARLDASELDPGRKATVLGETIASLMNYSLWGAPLGVVLAVARLLLNRRASRAGADASARPFAVGIHEIDGSRSVDEKRRDQSGKQTQK